MKTVKEAAKRGNIIRLQMVLESSSGESEWLGSFWEFSS